MTDAHSLVDIAQKFAQPAKVTHIRPWGTGNINDTFLVTLDSDPEKHFILQRINNQVFNRPEIVMQNIRILTEYVYHRLQNTPAQRRWETPRVLLTENHQDYWQDTHNQYWRAISFIDNCKSFDTLENITHASEIGYALGMFHHLISDLPSEKLADTLVGFHITPLYLHQYHQALTQSTLKPSPELNYCHQFISQRPSLPHILENAKINGILPLRLIHGDPKINNIMLDTATHKAVSIIDLDTVKPGLVHYDIGDCLRSGCNPAGEETQRWEEVYFDTEICRRILQGYIAIAQTFLTDNDYKYIYHAIRLLAFELGLRFFTDYLAGNVYFKVQYPEHNLIRALVQFKLTESIESQESTIREIITNFS